jgi:phage terminase large subunit-like protein
MKLTPPQRQATIERIELLEARQTRQDRRRLFAFYPESGPLRRSLYAKHMAFFAAGAKYRERCMMAGNRTGKTEGAGGYEVTLHLTGLYPAWWEGKRFAHPVRALVAGDTATTVRDIVQRKLCGPPEKPGTGLIPFANFGTTTTKAGVPGAYDIVKVKHEPTGQWSELQFRSYDQGRIAFQGTEREVVWCDEEPPKDVYDECLLRTMTTGGIVICTFTPLNGLSDVALAFLPHLAPVPAGEGAGSGGMEGMGPHSRVKSQMAHDPPQPRRAGFIYSVRGSDFVVEPFELFDWWPRAYAMEVGRNQTAALWGARDPDQDVIYLYSEHSLGRTEPSIHADAIKARGEWMWGAIGPTPFGSNHKGGTKLIEAYGRLGLNLVATDQAGEAGHQAVAQRLSSGRLKVFRTLSTWLSEFRRYRRSDKGQTVKENGLLMDCTQHLLLTGMKHASVDHDPDDEV